MKQVKAGVAALAIGSIAVFSGVAHAGKTLDAVKQRGQLICGVSTGLPGFSQADSQGNWSGLDVDVCKAVAASVLGDASKVKYVPLTAQQRFAALQAGEVDVLSRNTTWTLTRDASLGMLFTGVTYYDGQGFMVPTKTKVTSAKRLKGATVCVQSGTTTVRSLESWAATGLAQGDTLGAREIDKTLAQMGGGAPAGNMKMGTSEFSGTMTDTSKGNVYSTADNKLIASDPNNPKSFVNTGQDQPGAPAPNKAFTLGAGSLKRINQMLDDYGVSKDADRSPIIA
ncbi:MAG: hypothetical protein EBX66_06835, partial [Betaproteobacteria bacterium]|nr:hypothetical protein [Betaproteobacteria bacterium]